MCSGNDALGYIHCLQEVDCCWLSGKEWEEIGRDQSSFLGGGVDQDNGIDKEDRRWADEVNGS